MNHFEKDTSNAWSSQKPSKQTNRDSWTFVFQTLTNSSGVSNSTADVKQNP